MLLNRELARKEKTLNPAARAHIPNSHTPTQNSKWIKPSIHTKAIKQEKSSSTSNINKFKALKDIADEIEEEEGVKNSNHM